MMVYGVDLTAGGDVRGGCLQRRFRMEHEKHVQREASEGVKIAEGSIQGTKAVVVASKSDDVAVVS